MVHQIEDDNNVSKRDKAWAQAQAFREQLAARKSAQAPTAAAGSDDDSIAQDKTSKNKDRELHTKTQEGFDVKSTNASSTGVSANREQGGSSGGSSQQDSNSSGRREQVLLSNIAKATEAGAMRAANQVSFGDISPEDRQLSQLRNRVIDQYKQRFGMDLSDDAKAVLKGMTDPADLQNALRVMATQKRSDVQDPEVNAFEKAVETAHPDFFSPISVEEVEKQRQQA
ncbi:MAG TPA: hypothetical protein V6D23_05930 [Candidatus Obscuribacterales bacterium]